MFANRFPARLVAVLALALGAFSAQAGQALLPEKSSLYFMSLKNGNVAEVHTFRTLRGGIDDGRVSVTIPLVDVDTMIPIRNERMQTMLFDVENFPNATLTADVDMDQVMALEDGEYTDMTIQFTLDLYQRDKLITAPVTVARLGDEIHVSTDKPVVLNAAYFNLGDGIERLREVAGLKMISTAVPVTARLVFSRTPAPGAQAPAAGL